MQKASLSNAVLPLDPTKLTSTPPILTTLSKNSSLHRGSWKYLSRSADALPCLKGFLEDIFTIVNEEIKHLFTIV